MNDNQRKEGMGEKPPSASNMPIPLSVIVPFYNAERTLSATLKSIASQNMKNFEVLLVDDGSSDSSPSIAQSFAANDHRFFYMRQENQGAGAARNHGLRAARGNYLMFLDADDLFDPHFFEIMIDASMISGCDVAICHADAFDSKTGKSLGKTGPRFTLSEGSHKPDEYARHLLQRFATAPWDKLFKASFIREHNFAFQNLAYSNDSLFVVSALSAASVVYVTSKTLVHYRVGTGHSLRDNMSKDPYCDLLALDSIFDYLSIIEPYSTDMTASFREWAAGIVYAAARDLAMEDEKLVIEFCEEYFTSYDQKWGINELSYASTLSRKQLWQYRRMRGSSARGFCWACRCDIANRADRRQKTTFQKAMHAMRLLIADVFTRSMAKTYN